MIRGVLEYQIWANLVGVWITLTGGRIKSRGVLLDVKSENITNVVKWHLFSQTYEKRECDLLQKHFQPGIDVVEFGGGLGFVSCIIGRKEIKNKHIVVEPNPSILKTLAINRDLNNCNFKILNRAYSSTPGFVPFDTSGPFESSSININSPNIVESITLRKLINSMSLDQFILIVDIEGAEFDLLKQEFDILVYHCPLIIIEFHDQGSRRVKFVSKLERAGYSTFKEGDVYAFVKIPVETKGGGVK
jgi:FkbM family methyltransferase